MAVDTDAILDAAAAGEGIAKTVGMGFGMPECMLNLTEDLLNLLPTAILGAISMVLDSFITYALGSILRLINWMLQVFGIKIVETDNGIQILLPDFTFFGMNPASLLSTLGDYVKALDNTIAELGELYTNVQGSIAQFQELKNCLENWLASAEGDKEEESDDQKSMADRMGPYLNRINDTRAAISKATALRSTIGNIMKNRAQNPDLEPCFLPEFATILAGTPFKVCPPTDEADPESPFRLVFGPPISKKGQFLLTSDGLYYDSQTGGLEDVEFYLSHARKQSDPAKHWTFEHDPNIGGKGVQVSKADIVDYIDTLFDPNIEDDSPNLQAHYDADHLLELLEGQRNKQIYDLSSQLTTLEANEGSDSAVFVNNKQALYSELARHNDKIRRRRKQVEIAVKAPQMFDPGNSLGLLPLKGEVPVNDFTYLAQLNIGVTLEKQEPLVFSAAEIEGVVLPIEPKFVVSPTKHETWNVEHLVVPSLGIGDIIYNPSSVDGSSQAHVQSLTDSITTDGLIGAFNFLGSDIVSPSSGQFVTVNDVSVETSSNAKLVSDLSESVFFSGLAVPYLKGVTGFNEGGSKNVPSGVGSYIRLPDTKRFRNLAYKQEGFTVESWVHMPSLGVTGTAGWDDAGTSSVHRVLLSCENSGGKLPNPTTVFSSLAFDSSISSVRGLMMGFTRDIQLTENKLPTLDPGDQSDAGDPSKLKFVIAPTQSVDASTIGFVNNTSAGCADAATWYNCGVTLDTSTTEGKALTDTSSTYSLLTVTVEPPKDKITIYLDGYPLVTSSLATSFGTDIYRPIAVPSFTAENSFEYGVSSFDWKTFAPLLEGGPKFNTSIGYSFTPWIVGGGYSDGAYESTRINNFMNAYGGISSGLKGHIGSIKFYDKPLNNVEVIKNFNGQKGFFKNIVT